VAKQGTHRDNDIVHVVHEWRRRARKAERDLADHKGEKLLREVRETAIPSGPDSREVIISRDLWRRIIVHTEGEDG
jgi:hypothetical protein